MSVNDGPENGDGNPNVRSPEDEQEEDQDQEKDPEEAPDSSQANQNADPAALSPPIPPSASDADEDKDPPKKDEKFYKEQMETAKGLAHDLIQNGPRADKDSGEELGKAIMLLFQLLGLAVKYAYSKSKAEQEHHKENDIAPRVQKVDELTQKRDALENEIEDLKQDPVKNKDEISSKEKELEKINTERKQVLEDANQKTQAQLESSTKTIEDSMDRLDKAQKDLDNAEARKAANKKDLASIKPNDKGGAQKKKDLLKEKTQLKKTIKNLKKTLKRRKNESVEECAKAVPKMMEATKYKNELNITGKKDEVRESNKNFKKLESDIEKNKKSQQDAHEKTFKAEQDSKAKSEKLNGLTNEDPGRQEAQKEKDQAEDELKSAKAEEEKLKKETTESDTKFKAELKATQEKLGTQNKELTALEGLKDKIDARQPPKKYDQENVQKFLADIAEEERQEKEDEAVDEADEEAEDEADEEAEQEEEQAISSKVESPDIVSGTLLSSKPVEPTMMSAPTPTTEDESPKEQEVAQPPESSAISPPSPPPSTQQNAPSQSPSPTQEQGTSKKSLADQISDLFQYWVNSTPMAGSNNAQGGSPDPSNIAAWAPMANTLPWQYAQRVETIKEHLEKAGVPEAEQKEAQEAILKLANDNNVSNQKLPSMVDALLKEGKKQGLIGSNTPAPNQPDQQPQEQPQAQQKSTAPAQGVQRGPTPTPVPNQGDPKPNSLNQLVQGLENQKESLKKAEEVTAIQATGKKDGDVAGITTNVDLVNHCLDNGGGKPSVTPSFSSKATPATNKQSFIPTGDQTSVPSPTGDQTPVPSKKLTK